VGGAGGGKALKLASLRDPLCTDPGRKPGQPPSDDSPRLLPPTGYLLLLAPLPLSDVVVSAPAGETVSLLAGDRSHVRNTIPLSPSIRSETVWKHSGVTNPGSERPLIEQLSPFGRKRQRWARNSVADPTLHPPPSFEPLSPRDCAAFPHDVVTSLTHILLEADKPCHLLTAVTPDTSPSQSTAPFLYDNNIRRRQSLRRLQFEVWQVNRPQLWNPAAVSG
jgi:hypothetical protein